MATKNKTTELTVEEQVAEIVKYATGLGAILKGHSDKMRPEDRRRVERQISRAHEALHPKSWSPSARLKPYSNEQRSVMTWLEAGAQRLKDGSDEDWEVAIASYHI